MVCITTIVTGPQALNEFQLLLYTLEQWEPTAEVFVLTDAPTHKILRFIKSRIRIHFRVGLETYEGLTRKDMEARNGKRYATLFHDFTMEKATVLQWALEERKCGAWFLDADICLTAPLPSVGKRLGLSPHFIRAVDESRYGKYNAGMMWFHDVELLDIWRKAACGSRFYEQAALEEVANAAGTDLVEFPPQDNFGWWRYLQSADAPPVIAERFGYNRRVPGCGLTYEGAVLRSIHTHWEEDNAFNTFVKDRLEFLARSHSPAKTLLGHINRLKNKKKE
jgi:hypothetical protein